MVGPKLGAGLKYTHTQRNDVFFSSLHSGGDRHISI